MRKKIITVLVGITLSIIILFGLLPSCGGGGTGSTPNGTGVTANGSGQVAPLAEGQKWLWRYQSTGNAGTATYWTEEAFVGDILKASGGRMELVLAPQGAIVGPLEIFDAVATGAIEAGSC